MGLLEVSNLHVDFGKRRITAIDEISFQIEAGTRLGLIGESGSGKSVTALALMGLLPENANVSGSILFAGQQLVGSTDRQMSKIRGFSMSMVFQEPMTALDPTMKVGKQAAEVGWVHKTVSKKQAQQAVIRMFTRVGITDPERVAQCYPHQLSGGQRQRVLVAMALGNRPDLVICDEPTTALDVTVQAKVLDTLNHELHASKAACLFISHDLAVVSQMCSTVMVMWQGKIVETGSVSEVFSAPRHPYTKSLVAAAKIDQVKPGERLPVVEDFMRDVT